MKTGLEEEESAIEIEEQEKPVKKDAQGLLNSACITHFPHLSHLPY